MENNLLCFKRTSNLTALSLPKIYRESFYTKEGVWTKLIIIKGKMKLSFLDDENSVIKQLTLNKKNNIETIQPQSIFRINPTSTDLQFHLEFYCLPKDYFFNKYDLNPAHQEIVKAMKYVKPCKTLDLGAGQGKNSLYLSTLNFNITAVDINAKFLQDLADISIIEKLNMKKQTNDKGYNLIVSALNATKHGLPLTPFPFTFIENELKEYYEDWKIITYSENITASPYPYAVILAQKVSE